MSKIRHYVETLSPAERERFADLIDECTAREAAIEESASQAHAALDTLCARQHEFWGAVRELSAKAAQLRETVGRLYLITVPTQGQVS